MIKILDSRQEKYDRQQMKFIVKQDQTHYYNFFILFPKTKNLISQTEEIN